MKELELKLHVDERAWAPVERELKARGQSRRERLRAAYFDSADRRLAQAGMALRLRREGRRWVQTLKGGAAHDVERFEHNVERPGAGAQMPAIDPSLHAGTPVGDALLALFDVPEPPPLQELFQTDVQRLSARVRTRWGEVELALDRGEITAAGASLPVRELEIELVSGRAQAVIETARRWLKAQPDGALWLDSRSKAERGDCLARGVAASPAAKSAPAQLAPQMPLPEAWVGVMRSCVAQILPNASAVLAGAGSAEHVHQLRVGIRRLLSAHRLFDGVPPAGWEAALRDWFSLLGQARDREVLISQFEPALQAAGAPPVPSAPEVQPHDTAPRAATLALLDLVECALTAAGPAALPMPAGPDAPTLGEHATRRLRRWHRRAMADAPSFETLDDEARHRLRKRLKRLRYGLEFCSACFAAKPLARYLRRLRDAQEALGEFNDLAVAGAAFRERVADRPDDANAWFALGWLAARREQSIGAAGARLQRLRRATKFWKGAKRSP